MNEPAGGHSADRKISGDVRKLYFRRREAGCAKIHFLHSGAALKPHPGKNWQWSESADVSDFLPQGRSAYIRQGMSGGVCNTALTVPPMFRIPVILTLTEP